MARRMASSPQRALSAVQQFSKNSRFHSLLFGIKQLGSGRMLYFEFSKEPSGVGVFTHESQCCS